MQIVFKIHNPEIPDCRQKAAIPRLIPYMSYKPLNMPLFLIDERIPPLGANPIQRGFRRSTRRFTKLSVYVKILEHVSAVESRKKKILRINHFNSVEKI